MSLTSQRDREFRHCEICFWVCLCTQVSRPKDTTQPAQKIEKVPSVIWLCDDCLAKSQQSAN